MYVFMTIYFTCGNLKNNKRVLVINHVYFKNVTHVFFKAGLRFYS